MLNLVDRDSSHPDSALLPQDGDGAFVILRIGEHGYRHAAERAVPPAYVENAGIFHLDGPIEGGGIGLHALHRADQPIQQVHVMTGLVHEGPAVELPGAPPAVAVVVALRPGPEHVDVDHEDAAEPPLVDRVFQ